MRIALTLEHQARQVLPINYQYLISSWIYRTLGNADEAYARQLHDQGYHFGKKQYKLFTFTSLQPEWYDINKRDRTFILSTGPSTLQLSFYVDEAVQHFIVGLFKQRQFSLTSGRFHVDFKVANVEVLDKPPFTPTMRFKALTPICVSREIAGDRYATYESPELADYGKLLLKNLLRKRASLSLQTLDSYQEKLEISFPFDFRLLSTPRSKLLTIKGIQIRGYLFDFEITAPTDLIALGYFAGFGEKNSNLGMGWVRVL